MSKSRRGKSASANELSRWETELIQAPFNEETWRSCVFFIAPNKLEDNVFIDILSEVVATGLRKLFSVITFDGLVKDVKEFAKPAATGGKGKGAASAKPPQFHEVCEQVKPLMDQGEPIPPSLMAKLLKFKMLHVKQKDLERREEEKKAAKAAEAGKKDDKGKKSGRSPSAGKRSKSPGKKKGKKEADLPPSPKKDTKLKRRGDVEDTFKTIDDEPDDDGSPEHYIIIHGILTAPVIYHLSEIGISVDAIICMKAQNYESLTPAPEQQDEGKAEEDENAKEDDPEMLDKEIQDSEERAQKLEAESLLKAFWSESESIMMKAPSGHKLKDIARYEVRVKESVVPEGDLLELDAEKKTEFGTAMFEDVADVCYNMLDHLEQYKQYLDSMKLIHVPVHMKSSASASSIMQPATDPATMQSATAIQTLDAPLTPVSAEIDMRYYNHLIGSVPPESHSVPLILHCLLEQVVATVDENNPLDQPVPPRRDGLNHDLAAYISSKTSKLALPENDKQVVTEATDSNKLRKSQETPVILHYNDTMTSRLHHLEPENGLDPEKAELRMLDLFPQSRLKELPMLHGREIVEREARANELRHFCKSQMDSDGFLERALKQFTFEGMLLKVASDNGEIVDLRDVDESFKFYTNLWDHPYSKLSEFQALRFPSDDTEKVKLTSSSPLSSFRNLDEWCFVEHFDGKTMTQVLEAARLTNPYMDTYYHKRDHSLLVALHNPVGANSSSTSSWSTKLHSNVGFRNYLEHVVTSIGEWVREQERMREEAARTPTPPPPVPEQPSVPLKVGSRYGLMTRQEVALIKAEEEEKGKKKGKKSARGTRSPKRSASKSREKSASPDKKDDKDKKREGSASSRQKSASGRSPSAKGSRSIRSATSKTDKKGLSSTSRIGDFEEPEAVPVEDTVEEPYDFIGYDTGDNLIHVSGSLATMFPGDGGQIQVNKAQYVQGTRSVSTSVFKDGNMFVLHFLEPINEILTKEDEEGSDEKEDAGSLLDKNKLGDRKDEEVEKSEVEASEKEQHKPHKGPTPFCDFSSFVAELSDGMIVALSGYGPSGSLMEKDSKDSEDTVTGHLITDAAPPQPTPSPQPKAGSPKARKRAEEEAKRMEEIQQQQEEERLRLEEEAQRKAEEEKLKKPFQHVYITCPDGQHVQYLNDDCYQSKDDRGGVVVRQSYPVRPFGPAKEKPASEETSRTVMTDGTVIKLLTDGSVQVLFPDGAVSKCRSYPVKPPSAPPTSKPSSAVSRQDPSLATARKSLRGPAANQKPSEEPLVPVISLPEMVPEWSSTGVDGNRVVTGSDGGHVTVSGVHCSLATCPQSGQVLKTREDNVVTVDRPDGTRIVEHADGTRITTFYKQVQQELQAPDNETGEQAMYSDITKMFVKVECVGFATVIFDSNWGSCETIWGNGTRLHTQANGVSVLHKSDGTQLQIGAKGVVSYCSRGTVSNTRSNSPEPTVVDSKAPEGVYVMRTTSQLCCEMTDAKGTHFTVMSNGQMTVDKVETESVTKETAVTLEGTESEKQEPSAAGPLQQAPVSPLVPRFFIIHADGTGSELLRSVDVKEFLECADRDPATAVLKTPLEGHPDVTGLTIMKPYSGGIGKIWLKEKDEELIIPQGLRERDFKLMPSREIKKPGPVFGTNAGPYDIMHRPARWVVFQQLSAAPSQGNGLNIGSSVKPIPPPHITCPQTLEFRQLIQYKPLTTEQRQQITKAMDAYGDFMEKRQTGLDRLLPQDPRDENEKSVAEELEAKARLKEDTDREAKLQDEEGVGLNDEIRNTVETLSDQTKTEDISSKYVEEITPAPVPRPPPPKWKRSSSEWERDRIELAELDYGKHALRYKEVPLYFETTQGQEFLKRIYSQKVPDMEALTSELAHQTRHPPPGESSPPETPEIVVHEGSAASERTDGEKESPSLDIPLPSEAAANGETVTLATGDPSTTPNSMRPTNPTPAHATGNGTPTPVRPTNPTPSHASTATQPRPSNPTPKQASELLSQESPFQESSPQWTTNLESVQEVDVGEIAEEAVDVGGVVERVEADDPDEVPMFSADLPQVGPRSLYFDVTGETRKERVKLPSCIRGGKPGALPNTQFFEVEDPVRRRVQTVSVAGGDQEQIENLRGFELLPPQVSFGVLKEGCTYVCSVLLKNVGIDSCRYKVKQPPPSTGLRVLYKPGPVAAGMNTVLDVEIFAVAVGVVGESGMGHVGHHVEIVAETEILYLPVAATIMTVYEYEARYGDTEEGLGQGTRRVPNRPPSRDPTRPRKEEDYALLNESL